MNVTDAEFFIILTPDGLIESFAPTFETILQWRDVDVYRQPLSFLFPADAHGRVDRLVASDFPMERVVFPRVPLRYKPGGFINFDMTLKLRPDHKRLLEFFRPGNKDSHTDETPPPNDTTDMYSFFNFVERLLDSPYDEDLDMAMVEIDALRDESLSDTDKKQLRDSVETSLRACAVGGQIGQLDEASYGLLSDSGFDESAFEAELKTVAQKLNMDPAKFGVRSASVTLDDRDIESDALQQALSHSRGLFLGEVEGDADALNSLSSVIDGITHNRNLVVEALEKYNYRVSERVMLDNVGSITVAALLQGKVSVDGRLRLPDELIVLPDHPDVALKHDLAQLDEFVRVRRHKKAEDQEKPDFYELCRSCLLHDAFMGDLQAILDRHTTAAEKIGFRVKGLPPSRRGGPHWEAVKALAAAGHPIWLDRFGDAVTDAGIFSFLCRGYIELPGDILARLAEHFDGKEVMSGLINKWQENGVGVLTIDLKNMKLKTLAQEMGVRLSVQDSP